MAEGLINSLGAGNYKAVSAGSFPTGYVHPKSIETLNRHDIQIENPSSQSWDEYADQPFDYIITVCDQAANETCPVFPGNAQKLHWSTPDPAHAQGTEDDINAAFDDAFKLIKDRIEKELL
ncbi:UNVERIFIED_CONTAM: hypothetical protein GTU68_031483 [Idotea baltica]|nr:hypothetical protein [Idotea baltica]